MNPSTNGCATADQEKTHLVQEIGRGDLIAGTLRTLTEALLSDQDTVVSTDRLCDSLTNSCSAPVKPSTFTDSCEPSHTPRRPSRP